MPDFYFHIIFPASAANFRFHLKVSFRGKLVTTPKPHAPWLTAMHNPVSCTLGSEANVFALPKHGCLNSFLQFCPFFFQYMLIRVPESLGKYFPKSCVSFSGAAASIRAESHNGTALCRSRSEPHQVQNYHARTRGQTSTSESPGPVNMSLRMSKAGFVMWLN